MCLIPMLALPLLLSACISFGRPSTEPAATPEQEHDMIRGEFEYSVPEDSSTDPRDWVTPFDVGDSVVKTPSQHEGMNVLSVQVDLVPATSFAELVSSASQGLVDLDFEQSSGGATMLSGQADLSAQTGARFGMTVSMPGAVEDTNSPDVSGSEVSWMVQGGENTELWASTANQDGPRSLTWWTVATSLTGIAAVALVVAAVRLRWF